MASIITQAAREYALHGFAGVARLYYTLSPSERMRANLMTIECPNIDPNLDPAEQFAQAVVALTEVAPRGE